MMSLEYFIILIVIINTITSAIVVFRDKRRDISSVWAWLLVLTLFPVFGFLLYLFIGKSIAKESIFDLKTQERLGLKQTAEEQLSLLYQDKLGENSVEHSEDEKELISMFLQTEDAIYTNDNQIEIIVDGIEKFDKLLKDIENAQHHIHLQYFIFKNDNLGKFIMERLIARAKAGVEVLVLYDALGSRNLTPNFFKGLIKAGGQAEPFFGSSIPFVNLRFNYRNHRKIVVIDGRIGYVGGFNIGSEYLGRGRLGYWRDTHLRVQGSAVHALQTRFFVDWNAVTSNKIKFSELYFPKPIIKGKSAMQIVSSGPDSELEQIKLGFLKMIYLAKKRIDIQSPYFIPNESLLDALRIAILSGVEVNIMIPNKPDHPVVYRATEYYVNLCQQFGANIYLYQDGFIHSKVMIIDGKTASVGTANFDIRSFKLNFEVSAFIYDDKVAEKLETNFNRDLQKSMKVNADYFNKQSRWKKFKQMLFRLCSPIL